MTSTNNSTALYGAPRPKSKPIPLSSSSIHALTTELSAARSRVTATEKSAPAKPRPSKTNSLFRKPNKGVAERAAKDLRDGGGKTTEELGGEAVSERELARARRKMQEKAKLYEKMKRGDLDSGEGLVDFDRKWVENGSEDEAQGEEEEEEEEMVEYEDEFGRTRKGKKSEVEREKKRREDAMKEKEEDLRTKEPEGLIYGNTIQSHAFMTPAFSTVPKAEELKAALPTEEEEEKLQEAHYDASKEVRTKGVGFYQFSKDAEVRKAEMEELEKERKRTEFERKEKEERRKRKREELEKRKEQVRNKRRGKVGESWLEGEMGEMAQQSGDKT